MSILLVTSVAYADRNIAGNQNPDGTYLQVPKVGELFEKANHTGNHVYLERTSPGGWLYQYIDDDNDYECDFIFVWRVIDDPSYGRFYTPGGTEQCPDSKSKK